MQHMGGWQAGVSGVDSSEPSMDVRRLRVGGVLLAWWTLLMVAVLLGPAVMRRTSSQVTRWQPAGLRTSLANAATRQALTSQAAVSLVGQCRSRSLVQ